jgi:hypothetical protein
VFRPFLRGHIFQDPMGLLYECADVATHRFHHANPVGVDRGSMNGLALPSSLGLQLLGAGLRDAALGVSDAWNHDVLLRAIHRCGLECPSRAWLYPARSPQQAHRGDCGTDYGIWLTGDATLFSVIYADCGDAGYDQTMPQRTATAAAAARVLTLSLVKRFATWVWTVRVPM